MFRVDCWRLERGVHFGVADYHRVGDTELAFGYSFGGLGFWIYNSSIFGTLGFFRGQSSLSGTLGAFLLVEKNVFEIARPVPRLPLKGRFGACFL